MIYFWYYHLCDSVAVLLFLFFTKNELLAENTGEANLDSVRAFKTALLKRYLEEERLFNEKEINGLVWKQRQQYYMNRYIDASRREDYLKVLAEESES